MLGPLITLMKLGEEEITMRPPRKEDAAVAVAWFADTEVTKTVGHIFPIMTSREEEVFANWDADGASVHWIIAVNDVPIGVTSIEGIKPIDRRASTGTIIGNQAYWRKGIATAAMKARTEYAFMTLNLEKLTSSYVDGNIGSGKAQQKAGNQIVGVRKRQFFRNGVWKDEILTEVLRDDWLKARAAHRAPTTP